MTEREAPAGPDRRSLLTGLAAGATATGLALPAAAAQSTAAAAPVDPALGQAFAALLRPETRLSMLLDDAIVIDSDAPFPMTRAEHADHLAFHQPLWESRAWAPYDLATRMHGETAMVSGYLMERGKPRDAGFRLRPGYATAVLVRTDAGWRALALHLGALAGQIADISPG